ncbi:MAG: trigger factor [Oscillospiraceae bacterium]|nr:trigger factor [Oscillospiraceae bacterium]
MNVKIENIEKNTVKLEIELEADKLDEGLAESFKKNMKFFNVPGFRKGKAPRHIVERYYGVDVLYDDAANYLCPKYLEIAIKENDIIPVDKPILDVVKIERGEPLIFTALVIVKPEVILGAYKGVKVKYDNVLITDDDVEQELKELADRNARLKPVNDRPVEMGDVVNIDFEGFVDGERFDGGSAEGYSLNIGANQFISGFEEQIVGVSAGDEVEVNVTFPEDYKSEVLKGKPALFKVKVNEIKIREVPEIDDEFADDVSEFETLDEFKADIRKNLHEKEQKKVDREFENAVVKAVADDAGIDVPEVMIESQFEYDMKNFEISLRYQGIDIDSYLMYTRVSRAEFEKTMRERARNEVISQLVLEKVSQLESIVASEDDINKEIAERAEKVKKDVEEYKALLSEREIDSIRDNLQVGKVVDFLVENAEKI